MKALLALLFAIGAALSAPVALFAYNVEHNVLNKSAAHALLERGGLYTDLPRLAAESADEERPEALSEASSEDRFKLFSVLLAPDAIRPYIEHATDQFVGLARGESDVAVISSAELKRALRERMPQALEAATAGKPTCPRGSLRDADQHWLTCRPSPSEAGQYRERVLAAVDRSLAKMPESYRVPSTDSDARELEQQFPRALRAQLVQAAGWGWLVPVGLLVLIAMLYAHSRRAMAAWVGMSILIGGALAFAAAKFIQYFWNSSIAEMRAKAADSGDQFGARVTEAIGQAFLDPTLLHSAVLAGMGAVLVVAAFVMHDEDTTTGPWPG